MINPALYKDIKFWLLLFFVLRLVGIFNPPLESSHNWRQTTGLMIARSFLEVDHNILYPRKEDHKGTTGIIGIEFPVLNYSHYLISAAFGYTHWYSRLINLILSTLGIWYFYKIVKKQVNDSVAFYSALVLISSIWFMFSRKSMPDTFSISLVIIGVYYGIEYIQTKKWKHLTLFFGMATLGMLAKIPAALFLGLMVYPFLKNRFFTREKVLICLTSAASVFIVYWWYFIWNPYLSYAYGVWYNLGFPLDVGLTAIWNELPAALERFYFSATQSFVFFLCSVVGFIWVIRKKQYSILLLVLPVMLGFVFYILKAGEIFIHHSYYMVPFAPVMAVFAGYTLSEIKWPRWALIICFIGIVEGIANQHHDFFIKDSERYKLTLERIADEHIPKESWVGINSIDENHQRMYLAHRKGWMILNEDVLKTDVLEDHKNRGCSYIIIDKHIQQHKPLLDLIFENEDFGVYKL